MPESLRPLTLGEILDRTAQLYRRNLLLLAGIAALPIGAMLGCFVLAGTILIPFARELRGSTAPAALAAALAAAVMLIALPIFIAATVFSQAGITRAAISAYQGKKITIREALQSVRPRFWRYLWLLVLQGLLVAAVPAAFIALLVGAATYLQKLLGFGSGPGVLLGIVSFLVVMAAGVVIVWRLLGYILALAVCVAEDKPAWPSLRRALQLSKGTRGRIFVMILVVFALMMVLSMLGYIPVLLIVAIAAMVSRGAPHAMVMVAVADACSFLINFTLQTLVTPAMFVALVFFYYDQRIRLEGYDIEWMMQQARLAPPEAAVAADAAASPTTLPLPAAVKEP